jgi:hypothetical protein
VFMNKGILSATFVKLFPSPFIWNIKITFFVKSNRSFKFYMTWVILHDLIYKFWNDFFSLSESYLVLKLGGSQNFKVWCS